VSGGAREVEFFNRGIILLTMDDEAAGRFHRFAARLGDFDLA